MHEIVLRWLLPLIAAVAVLAGSITARAASGVFAEAKCCCPVKAKCKCHDHDNTPQPIDKMKRCGGEAKIVAPATIAAVPTSSVTFETLVVEQTLLPLPLPACEIRIVDPPEKPPF